MFVIHKSSIRHRYKFFWFMKTATNTSKNLKLNRKVREEIVEAISTIVFSENFFYDPLNVFSKQMRTISIMIKL